MKLGLQFSLTEGLNHKFKSNRYDYSGYLFLMDEFYILYFSRNSFISPNLTNLGAQRFLVFIFDIVNFILFFSLSGWGFVSFIDLKKQVLLLLIISYCAVFSISLISSFKNYFKFCLFGV